MHKSALKAILFLLLVCLGFGGLVYYGLTHISETPSENNTSQTGTSAKRNTSKTATSSQSKSSLLLEMDVSKIFTQDQLDELFQRTVDVIKRRLEQYGITDAVVTKEGNKFISVNLPGVVDLENIAALITNNERLEFRLVTHDAASNEALNKIYEIANPFNTDGTLTEEAKKFVPAGITVMQNKWGGYLAVEDKIILSGEDIKNVRVKEDVLPSIFFETTPNGAKKLGHFTSANIGRQLAIIFGNQVLSAPLINAHISNAAQITGNFEKDEAKQLAVILDTGTLPTQVKVIKRQVALS